MPRPVSWPSKIEAPPEALEFYELLAKLQRDRVAFRDCHIFNGATVHDIPHVRWDTNVTNLPRAICGFMGLPYRKRHCHTPRCINPFHYVDINRMVAFQTEETMELAIVPPPNLEDQLELVNHYIDEHEIKEVTFNNLRPLIPSEDMDDELLNRTLKLKLNQS